MKISEIRELTTDEIVERIDTEKTHLLRLRMNHAVSPLDNPQEIKKIRRTIARLHTERTRRQLNNENDGDKKKS